jgi:hypothetical protein
MPERQWGRDPNRHRGESQEKPRAAFYRAARYQSEEFSEHPYDQAQQLIHDEPCDLSTYRLRIGPEYHWHVAVLGEVPPEGLVRRIEEVLKTGEPVSLPDDVLTVLSLRRVQQMQHGPWVERHYGKRRRRI